MPLTESLCEAGFRVTKWGACHSGAQLAPRQAFRPVGSPEYHAAEQEGASAPGKGQQLRFLQPSSPEFTGKDRGNAPC